MDAFEIVFTSNATKSYPTHIHESSYIIGVIQKGSITITFGNENKTYKADDCFIITPNRPHSISSNADYSAVSVCIKTSVFIRLNLSIKNEIFRTLLTYIGEHLSAFQFEALVLHLNLLFKNPALPQVTDFEPIKNFVKNTIQDKNNLDTLSALSNYSKYHFERKFKKDVGLSPHDYQIQAKIKYAKYLLINKMPITKVAADLGFTDQSHFNRCFKKHVGLTPKQYICSFRTV